MEKDKLPTSIGAINTLASLQANLNVSIIGNSSYTALIDEKGCIVWCCLPRFDADPVFCSLLRKTKDIGFFDIEMQGLTKSSQNYIKNTPILATTLEDNFGNSLDIIDFAPRFQNYGRSYLPTMLVRMITPRGRPSLKIRVRPTFGYGWGTPEKTRGSNHIRFLLPTGTLRLTTNAPISYILHEVRFEVEEPIYMLLMPDESLLTGIGEFAVSNFETTKNHWQQWVSDLSIPYEWQAEIIRASITLKLCNYEETGAMVSAMTTSIPSSPNGYPLDQRYSWVLESPFIVRAFTQLGKSTTLNPYLKHLSNVIQNVCQENYKMHPFYGLTLETSLHRRDLHRLPGYRGLSSVVLGDDSFKETIHGGYGSVILASTVLFFDERYFTNGDKYLFSRLEGIGNKIMEIYNAPGRGFFFMATNGPPDESDKEYLHLSTALICWAACKRLERLGNKLQIEESEIIWDEHKQVIAKYIENTFWSENKKCYMSKVKKNLESENVVVVEDSGSIDAYLLLLPAIKYVEYQNDKFIHTLKAVEDNLRNGDGWIVEDEGKKNDNYSYIVFMFLYIDCLFEVGRKSEAKSLFEKVLRCCNNTGILSESVDTKTKELWGNFPSTVATACMISTAHRISARWEDSLF